MFTYRQMIQTELLYYPHFNVVELGRTLKVLSEVAREPGSLKNADDWLNM